MSKISVGLQYGSGKHRCDDMVMDWIYPINADTSNPPMKIYTCDYINLDCVLKLYGDLPNAGRGRYGTHFHHQQLKNKSCLFNGMIISYYPRFGQGQNVSNFVTLIKRLFTNPQTDQLDYSQLTTLTIHLHQVNPSCEYKLIHFFMRRCRNLQTFTISSNIIPELPFNLIRRMISRNRNLTHFRLISRQEQCTDDMIQLIDPTRQLTDLQITNDIENDVPRGLIQPNDLPNYVKTSRLERATLNCPSYDNPSNFTQIVSCSTLKYLKLVILEPIPVLYDRLNCLISSCSNLEHIVLHFVRETPDLSYLVNSLSITPNLQSLQVVVTVCETGPITDLPETQHIQEVCNSKRNKNGLHHLTITSSEHIICSGW